MRSGKARRKITPETALKKQVKDLFKVLQIYNFPYMAFPYGQRGVSDRIALYKGQTWYIETKIGKNGLSNEQKDFRDECERAGCPYVAAYKVEDIIEAMDLPVLV